MVWCASSTRSLGATRQAESHTPDWSWARSHRNASRSSNDLSGSTQPDRHRSGFGGARGPKQPFAARWVREFWGRSAGQGELLGFISLANVSSRRWRLEAKSSDIRGRDRSKQLQPKRRQGRQSDFGAVSAKSCIGPGSDTANPDMDEGAIRRDASGFGPDRDDPVKQTTSLDFHRQRNPARW